MKRKLEFKTDSSSEVDFGAITSGSLKVESVSRVPKCRCQLAPVVQVVVDDEGCVVDGRQQVRHGGGARLVAPAEGQSVQRRVKEVPRLGQRGLGVAGITQEI